MANTVKLKRSSVAGKIPLTTDLEFGEIALNTADGNLFFKKATNDNVGFIVTATTLTGTQTVLNKTIEQSTLVSPIITGELQLGEGNGGLNGQVLTSTGTGVGWEDIPTPALSSLSDVSISSALSNQVLKYNGSVWINADNDTAVASAVFATNAESDLGSVTDLIIGISEDLGFIADTPAAYIYNMGKLQVDGIVSLSNLDQSVKADYIAYSIIFGF